MIIASIKQQKALEKSNFSQKLMPTGMFFHCKSRDIFDLLGEHVPNTRRSTNFLNAIFMYGRAYRL